jgi:hypothetical protein
MRREGRKYTYDPVAGYVADLPSRHAGGRVLGAAVCGWSTASGVELDWGGCGGGGEGEDGGDEGLHFDGDCCGWLVGLRWLSLDDVSVSECDETLAEW